MKMEFDITKITEKIAMQAKENQEEFIIETIRPYCEDILQIKINKAELKQILLKGVQKQEPCDDCISREKAKQFLYERIDRLNDDELYDIFSRIIDDMYNELPSVTPQPKIGHWIIKDGKEQGYDIGGVKTWYIQIMCSECGFIETAIEGHIGQYHYCPNCGAKM